MTASRRRRRGGQATVEFGLVAPLFLLVFFAVIDAALWGVENAAAVASTDEAMRVASSAALNPATGGQPDPAAVTNSIKGRLGQALFGTSIVPWCNGSSSPCPMNVPPFNSPGCPTPSQVQARFGPRTVAVCAKAVPGSYPGQGDTPQVQVEIVGYVASLTPPGFGLGWQAGEIPMDVGAIAHAQRFAP